MSSDNVKVVCSAAREQIHAVLDGPIDADRMQSLREHLAGCCACREFESELRAVQAALRAVPLHRMPDESLEQVWQQTVRAPRQSVWRRPQWRAAAAAAALALALGAGWLGLSRQGANGYVYDEEEAMRAAAEARYVLELTAAAMRRTQDRSMKKVFGSAVGPLLERVPLQPSGPSDTTGRIEP
jgi:anti-sigma factor RsiW